MKSNKTLAALVTLGLAAAVATPAMAFENQISGAFTSFYDVSNYSAAGNDGFPSSTNKTGLSTSPNSQNYFVQRVRLGYTAKASEDVKLVTKFELDYNWYGNSSYANARGGGGAIGADTVNLETKNIYLDLNVVKGLNAKIGMQGNTDAFKGIIFDADMAGIQLEHAYDKASVSAGFFRFGDKTDSNTWAGIDSIGKYTNDMFALDGKFSPSKELKVGAAYYYIVDNRSTPNDARIHTLGLNAEAAVGAATINGFVLAQFGDYNHAGINNSSNKAKGVAVNLGAKLPVGPGTARAEFLYASGGKNGKSLYIPTNNYPLTEGGGFYDNEMIILSRDKNATTIDSAIVFDANNKDQGVIFASVGYDHNFSQKLSGSANLGIGFAAKTDKAVTDNKSDFLGTEINCEANYKLMPTVTLGARAGYMILGDYFKSDTGAHGTFDNPYDVKLIAKYSF
jgi:hypothetical protein